MNEADRKLLTEMIGECEHKWEVLVKSQWDGLTYFGCHKCGGRAQRESSYPYPDKISRTFLTGNDMLAVKQAIETKGDWYCFWNFAVDKWMEEPFDLTVSQDEGSFDSDFSLWLFTPERFCQLAAEWAKQKAQS